MRLRPMGRAEIFSRIHAENGWRCAESRSGPGSSLAATEVIRGELTAWLRTAGIRSLLDVPCGDFHWMQHVPLEGIDYTGADIVPEIIAQNRLRFEQAGRRFLVLDLVEQALPKADVVLSRDVLVHLPLQEAQRALHNVCASGCAYAALTHFPGVAENRDVRVGAWRPLNLCAAPFHWPQPAVALAEYHHPGVPEEMRKTLSIWRIEDVQQALSPAG